MFGFFESLFDELSTRWKVRHAPRTQRAYRCECDRPVFFRDHHCHGCEAPLGYEPGLGEMRTVHGGSAPGRWRLGGDGAPGREYRRCANAELPARCNWLVPEDDEEELCVACRLNRTIPNLKDADNRRYWKAVETAKRRLVSQLLSLDLPVESKEVRPEDGLAFDLLRSPPKGPRVMTGHSNGLITINVEEADDAKREKIRQDLHEPYRTLLGQFRHEVGHYYWDRLIRDTPWLEPFRALFGDEREDYAAAIKANYDSGPPEDWADRHISSYASSHPWEDWAETWAHYLHVVDSLSTAMSHGLDAEDLELDIEPFTREDLYDPDHEDAEPTLLLLNSWVEMVAVLNEMARSLGQPDFYPFRLTGPVVKKLHFIQLVVLDAQRRARAADPGGEAGRE